MENDIEKNVVNGYSEHSKPSLIALGEKSVTLSPSQLEHQVKLLQQRLTALGDLTQRTIAVALPNSIELVTLFFAITRSRGIAALLDPNNKEDEIKSYLEATDPILVIVTAEANDENGDLVTAAKRHGATIAECYWDRQGVILNTIGQNKQTNGGHRLSEYIEPLDTDIAVLLRTSGTTGTPKIVGLLSLDIKILFDFILQVPLTHKNLDVSTRESNPLRSVLHALTSR